MIDVVVSAVCAIVPSPPAEEEDSVTRFEVGGASYELINATYPHDDPDAPRPKERKLMRRDVALALVGVGRLLRGTRLGPTELQDGCLYLATGLSQDTTFEESLTELTQGYLFDDEEIPVAKKNADFYRHLPPLMALAGLANSSASFIAKHYSILGRNAVFGVTALAGHTALREAADKLSSGVASIAVAGGANAVGKLSVLAYAPFGPGRGRVRESESAAFLLLESAEHAARAGRRSLCRIDELWAVPKLPSANVEPGEPFAHPRVSELLDQVDHIVVGGSPFGLDHEQVRRALDGAGVPVSGTYDAIGCTGAASVPLSVGSGARLIASGRAERVACLTRDLYGRESVVTLAASAI